MFLRALLAFIALPGVVAFGLPLVVAVYSGAHLTPSFVAALLLGLGTFGLLCCVWSFYVNGRGTLAPWSPPARLVVVGLYRYSRNPMYVSVLLMLVGWSVLFQSLALAVYAAVVAVAFHIRVVVAEEPWLAHTHGSAWAPYCARVPRWVGFRATTVSSDDEA